MTHLTCLSRLHLLMTLALAAALTSCSTPQYQEVRRPAPGGGVYVQRIKINPDAAVGRAGSAAPGRAGAVAGRKGGFSWFGFGRKAAPPPVSDGSYWNGDAMTGKPSMRISLSEQRVFFYKDGKLAGVSPISSGREGYSTAPGSFAVIEKDLHHRSSLYGDYVTSDGTVVKSDVDVRKDAMPAGTRFLGANMRYFMRITGAVGMHEGYLPGYPASHGCIRLPGRMAAAFYRAAPLGTPVQIVR